MLRFVLLINFLMLSFKASAYIGPGTSAGTIAVVFGILGSIFLFLLAVLWYPFKRLMKKKKEAKKEKIKDEEM